MAPNATTKPYNPIEHPSHDDEDDYDTLSILKAASKVYDDYESVPEEFWEPCRRLSKRELETGMMIEGYHITDVLVSMCRIVHTSFGHSNEGSMPVKLVDITPLLNTCIVTYKDQDGKCIHYVNPTVIDFESSDTLKIIYRHKSFPYAGKNFARFKSDILVNYQKFTDNKLPQTLTSKISGNHSLFFQDAYRIMQGDYPPRINKL